MKRKFINEYNIIFNEIEKKLYWIESIFLSIETEPEQNVVIDVNTNG